MSTRKKSAPEKQAKTRFRKDVEARGEAAELTPEGKLPPGKTHAIVRKADGTTELKRGRFKLF